MSAVRFTRRVRSWREDPRHGRAAARAWRPSGWHVGPETTGLGGWSLDIHHAYSPFSRTVYLGDGQQQSAEDLVQHFGARSPA